jgi:hypothetical protein
MRYRLILLLTIGTLVSCTEKKKTEISEPVKIVDSFFQTYKTDGPNRAIRRLLPTNKYISSQDTDTVAIKLEKLSKDLGDFQGYELIRERTYGKGITNLAYIVKYSRQPLRFNFKFYNPGNGWRIQNFGYEVEFLDELDETVKPYRLKENFEVDEY